MMLVVDLLHEFELGVWKAIFIHLLRILETLKQLQISEMDKQWTLNDCMFFQTHQALGIVKFPLSEKIQSTAFGRIPRS